MTERLQVLAGHLACGQDSDDHVQRVSTAAADHGEANYAVVLPEKLSADGEWTVRRCVLPHVHALAC